MRGLLTGRMWTGTEWGEICIIRLRPVDGTVFVDVIDLYCMILEGRAEGVVVI